MKRCHNDFNGGLIGKFWMFACWHAAPVIANGQPVGRFKVNINPVGMASNSFIHRIIENFSSQMMQGAVVSAANIHSRTMANRL